MLGIHNIQIGYSDGPHDRFCLPDFLEDAGEGASKLHGIRGDIPDHGLIHTWRTLVGLCRQAQYELWPLVFLGYLHNSG